MHKRMPGKASSLGRTRKGFDSVHDLILYTAVMNKDPIKMPEKGTYKWQLFKQWTDEFRQTHADHVAYIALHLAGVLDPYRNKLNSLVQHHRQHLRDTNAGDRHSRAIERLQNTMTGAAISYETNFRHH
jgi:hypothetical protein